MAHGYTAKENPMDTLIKVDLAAPATDHDVIHNRWHPDIPIVSWVEPGAQFRVECIDWTGGQIKNNDSATDVKIVDLSKVHYLSGPIGVTGAEPGDLLVVDILDVGVLPDYQWGFTGIFAKENGGGFLTNAYPEARKACWDFSGIYANTRHIPGVEFAGIMHPGLIGCLPSKDLLATWNKREKALFDTDPERVPPLAALPSSPTAHMGRMKADAAKAAAMEGARTVATATSRISRVARACTFRCTSRAADSPWVTSTSPRETVKSPFAAPS